MHAFVPISQAYGGNSKCQAAFHSGRRIITEAEKAVRGSDRGTGLLPPFEKQNKGHGEITLYRRKHKSSRGEQSRQLFTSSKADNFFLFPQLYLLENGFKDSFFGSKKWLYTESYSDKPAHLRKNMPSQGGQPVGSRIYGGLL